MKRKVHDIVKVNETQNHLIFFSPEYKSEGVISQSISLAVMEESKTLKLTGSKLFKDTNELIEFALSEKEVDKLIECMREYKNIIEGL